MKLLTLLAQLKINPDDIGYNTSIRSSDTGLTMILDMIYFWAGIVAVLVIILAGFFFVTARGDATQMKRSKDALRGAVIGLIVVLIAFAITRFVIGGVQG